jgi:hypothetical protein
VGQSKIAPAVPLLPCVPEVSASNPNRVVVDREVFHTVSQSLPKNLRPRFLPSTSLPIHSQIILPIDAMYQG